MLPKFNPLERIELATLSPAPVVLVANFLVTPLVLVALSEPAVTSVPSAIPNTPPALTY